ncbi:MAG TPA: carboxylating nicotinate-nucleotide diphosphorylase [Candidatus Dormibacteraeota bacterium]|nr:carboxylating nicotinate-nucleotide diphosphorylase [Candidatus Dormibacteraeota bacterium]
MKQAFFRGDTLTIENPVYRQSVVALTDALLQDDLANGDLTASAMDLKPARVSASVIARESGIIAGLEEFALLYRGRGIDVVLEKRDGEPIGPGDTVLLAQGDQTKLLSLERVGLNLLQRMSGIATASHRAQERVRNSGSDTRVIGTRKTPWGLLDKRALHLGGVGTHRLNLGDAILIKNNHLALLANREEDAATLAIQRAWKLRERAAFIEVEVRSDTAARAAAATFRSLLEQFDEEYPCVLMLDNMSPVQIGAVLDMLRREDLWDYVLVEASGGISEDNLLEYAASGVDAISIGALTHSVRALDLSQRIS